MPKTTTPIGPVSAAYVGLTGQASALTQLVSVRSGGSTFTEQLPSKYEVSIGGPIQEGNHAVTITLSFLGKADEITRLVRGLSPFETDINAPIGQTHYALMVLGPDPESGGNFYFPEVWTNKSTELVQTKNAPTITSVTFLCENRDVTVDLHYEGNLVTMSGVASGQYPL